MYTSFLRLGRAFAPTRDALIHFAILAGLLSLASIARAQINISHLSTYATGSYNTAAAEIVTYDAVNDRIFFVNAQLNQVVALDASNPAAPTLAFTLPMAAYGASANSVAVVPGGIAVAVEANTKTDPGTAVFFNASGVFLSQLTVGALPDMITVTPDGTKVLVANEGEPNTAYTIDPFGTVSVIDITGGLATLTAANVTTIDFSAYTPAMIPGVRIFGPGASVAQDMEPEYITVSDDSQKAYVACQENNAVVRINLATNTIEQITALGYKDHSLAGNGLDASDSPTGINIATWPVRGLYMPDAIDSYTVGGQTYVVYANEGDAREYTPLNEPRRIGNAAYVLDPTVFPNAATLKTNANLGRLNATISSGDIDTDGDYDEIYVFGSRSFTIRDANGVIVYDSGDDFEQITAAALATNFNCNNSANGTFDTRSDDKGPEPEAVVLGKVGSQTYAFIGLERIGGVMVYDVTIPAAPVFVQYLNHRNFAGNAAAGTALDLGVESIVFVSEAQSPDGKPFIITSNEISGTVSLFRISGPAYTGCSSTQDPYLNPLGAGNTTTSILTVGDVVGGYDLVGIPDGMGAYDNNNGTFTLLVNHELGATLGTTRAHGFAGSFVSKWVINKSDLCVQSGGDLITTLLTWNGSSFVPATAPIGRLCSGDLPATSAFYNAGTGKGTTERIFMSGEEVGAEGRAFAHIATGTNAGTSYELPYLGKFSWENTLANPATGDKTVVVGTDDTTPGQVYVYIGTKQSTGNEIQKAGLQNGKLFGIKVTGIALETAATFPGVSTPFTLFDLGFVQNTTGAALQTASVANGVTEFLRPEDAHWDPSNPSDLYFVTTASFTGPSRLYKVSFTDILQPELGGTIVALLDGTEGQKMMDNMTVDQRGGIYIQEDPGNQAHIAKLWKYEIATDVLTQVGYADSARFITGAPLFLTQDEEHSGIIDMQDILGKGRYLFNVQAHYGIPGELVEGGQLLEFATGDTAQACVPALITSITGAQTIDYTDTLALNVAASGTLPLTYSWSGNGSFLFGSSSASALVDNAITGSYTVTVTNACGSDNDAVAVTVNGPAYTGCSSSQSPYLKPIGAGRTTTSILTVGDLIGGYDMVGIPDGMGAYDNNNGTFTLLVNHELGATLGTTRAHGFAGSFESKWVINKSDLCVQSGGDLITTLLTWNGSSFVPATAPIGRLCSGDLPPVSAFYNAGTGKGTQERIFMSGEEVGAEGRAFAHISSGTNAGTSYELPYLGKFSWENTLANPATGDKTVVVGTDDTTPGQVYVYIGTKQSTGNEIQKAGLQNGKLFGIKVTGIALETAGTFPGVSTPFTLFDLGFVQNSTGAALQTASVANGVTEFLRPEDAHWDPSNPNVLYFVTTASFTGPSRLYKATFTDIFNPELGGTIVALLDGTEGQKMMDNMTVDQRGGIYIQEDPGNQTHIAKLWKYDIATDVLAQVGYADSARFITGAPLFLTQDEEHSGIIDMQDILGKGRYLFNVQAHYGIPGELVEGGQLLEFATSDTIAPCVPALITAITDTTALCGIDTLELNGAASGTLPLSYNWSGTGSYLFGNTSASALVTGAASGFYILTVTNACGTAVDTVVVTVAPQITYYADVDGDGFGDPAVDSLSCTQPVGYVADNTDNCPAVVGLIGSTCDDGNANTTGDVIDANCVCAGTPVPCNGNEVSFVLTTDASANETSWDIVVFGTNNVVCSGSGYSNLSTITEQCCLADGCYDLRVFDSFGDGINPGGFVLRDENNNRILDNANDGIFGTVSKAPGGFCLPLGTDQLTVATCDQEALSSASVIQAVVNPAVSAQLGISNATSGYQFWIFNPDGGYSRTIFKSIASPGVGYPAGTPVAQRPAYLKLSSMVTSPVPGFTLLNVRVRSRVNGLYSAYGPACRMKLDPLGNCTTTQLVDNTQSNQHSCGVSGKVVNNMDKIYANVVAGANKYQFRFENATEGYVRNIASTTNALTLNKWATAPLLCGTFTYDVTVRVSFDGGTSYCPYGAVCTVGITNNAPNPCTAPFQGGGGNLNSLVDGTRASDLAIWPNPTRDGRVTIELEAIAPGTKEVTITVFDLFGKQVMASTIGVEGAEQLNTVLQLPAVSAGLYTVQVTVGAEILTRRLVVE